MILLTGGAGFIGSNIAKRLNKIAIDDIIIIDNLLNSDKYKNLVQLKFKDYIDKEDFINNLDNFSKENIELIIHQGACTDTTEYDGKYMIKNNYEYSKKLINFCIRNNINIIYASSAAVYGNSNCFQEDNDNCQKPLNIYGFSKLLVDRYVSNLVKQNLKIQITGLRYFNVFGPGEFHKGKMSSVILQFFRQHKKKKNIKLFEGSKDFKRDFIYIDDLVNIVQFFINNKISGIFNIGSGQAHSFYEIAEIFKEQLNSKIEYIPFPDKLKGKYQYYTQANLEKLNKLYKFKFKDFKEAIKEYINYLKEDDYFIN